MTSERITTISLLNWSNVLLTLSCCSYFCLNPVSALRAWAFSGTLLLTWFLVMFKNKFQSSNHKIKHDKKQVSSKLFEFKNQTRSIFLNGFYHNCLFGFQNQILSLEPLSGIRLNFCCSNPSF